MKAPAVYIVDADRNSRVAISRELARAGLAGRPFCTGADFCDEIGNLPAGIVLLDVQNAGQNGFDVLAAAAQRAMASPIVAMSAAADVDIAVAAMKRGAIDFLVKPIDAEALSESIGAALAILAQRQLLLERSGRDDACLIKLSPRENEVLGLLTNGASNKEIARTLTLGVRTVEAHRATIISKLGVANTAAAIAMLARHQTATQARCARMVVAG